MSQSQTPNSSATSIRKLLDDCLLSLQAIFPGWRAAVSGDHQAWTTEYKRQLLSAFVEFGVNSPEKINRGLSRARKSQKPWLPGPGEFCGWCLPRPSDYGMPEAALAFDHARDQCGKPAQWRTWPHEAVYLAAVDTGFFELKSLRDGDQNFKAVRARFCDSYESYVKRVTAGEKLSTPEKFRVTQQPVDYSEPRHRQAGEKTLGGLKGMFDE